ncbi:unnamed protein product, partial [Symbiodinium necroappetens]
ELSHAEYREFAPTYSDVGFRIPEESDPRNKKPKQDDPDYAYGPDFFSYIQKHSHNLEIRCKYKISTPDDYTTPCTTPHSGKAHADLISYENLQSQRAREIDELYTRPFDDIVVEEFISNLPGPPIEEVDEPMEQAGGSADAPADSPSGEMAGEAKQDPADSPSGEMAGEAKQEPNSSEPMETDAPEGSPSGEESGVKVEEAERTTFPPTAAPDDVRMDDAGETGDRATGSSPSGEAPMPDMNFSADAANDHNNLYEQGIWGRLSFEDFAGEKEKEGLADTVDYQNFREAYHLIRNE